MLNKPYPSPCHIYIAVNNKDVQVITLQETLEKATKSGTQQIRLETSLP